MTANQNLNRAIAIIGLIGFLAVAAVSDRIIFFINRQARQSGDFWIPAWGESIAILVSGASFLLLAWFILAKLSRDATFTGLVFLVLGLFLIFYPEIYYSPLRIGIVDYLGAYHAPGSFLNHTGGLIFALGLLLLIRRKGIVDRERKNV